MINVLALYADMGGCGDYRVRFPAEAVNARSNELGVTVQVSDHVDADAVKTGSETRIRRVHVPNGTHVVSFQRPIKADMAGAIFWLRQHRPDIAVVVDLDDDLAVTPVSNQAYRAVHPSFNPAENYRWLRKSIAQADVLTVSTPTLAERYGWGPDRTRVVRNGVPVSMIDQPARALDRRRIHGHELNRDRVIGWAGAVATHSGDLDVMCGALRDVVGSDRTDGRRVTFRNVGPRDGLSAALGLRDDDIEVTGWVSTQLYRIALGEMDVGLVPLADNRFNVSKSYLKAIEFAAAGVPVIASETPEHVELVRSGLPIWVVKNRRRHWSGAIRRVLDLDDDELAELAAAHRETTRDFHSTTSRAGEWAEAWRAAAKLVRSTT